MTGRGVGGYIDGLYSILGGVKFDIVSPPCYSFLWSAPAGWRMPSGILEKGMVEAPRDKYPFILPATQNGQQPLNAGCERIKREDEVRVQGRGADRTASGRQLEPIQEANVS